MYCWERVLGGNLAEVPLRSGLFDDHVSYVSVVCLPLTGRVGRDTHDGRDIESDSLH